MQTNLVEECHICKICGMDYQIYGSNGLCDDCDIGLRFWPWDRDENFEW